MQALDSPLAQIFCFTLAPDLLGGTCLRFTEDQLAFLPEGTADLPYMGTLADGGEIDVTALKYMNVQAVFSISAADLTDVNVADALMLEEQTGIPAVLIDGSFDKIGETYLLLGECLGRQERAEFLAQYCQDILERVTAAVDSVPQEKRVRFYFAEGPEGLQTESDASQHALAFSVAGGVNVVKDTGSPVLGREMADVTIEQIQEWDPEVIITWNSTERASALNLIRNSAQWAGVTAVREGRVYEMPCLPFAFCDRPPGVNRFLGIQWLANLFYPDAYDVDMVDVVRDFYARCYWRNITVEQAKEVLGESYEAK